MKKNKTIVLLLVLAMVLTAFVGCGGDSDTQDGGDAAKTYVIGMDTTFPPFEYQNEKQEYVGVDVDLLAAIAEDQGFQYKIDILGFNAAVQALEAKQVDAVIAGMSITEDRLLKYNFSDPYYDSGVVMGIAQKNDKVKGYADIKGQKVSVKIGTEGATFAESIKDEYNLELVYFEDSSFMYEDVKAGNSVACFEDYPVLGYGVKQNNGLKIVTEKEQGSSYGFAVLKGENPELLEMFNKGLANIRENGTYQEILDTYISE